MVDIQSEFGALCRLVSLKASKRFHDKLEEQGINVSPEQAITINAVASAGELRQGELMSLSYLASEKSKVSRVVQGLVVDGLIDRRDDVHDRRSKILTLTEKGQALADKLLQAEQFNGELVSSLLSQQESALLQSTLKKVVSAL